MKKIGASFKKPSVAPVARHFQTWTATFSVGSRDPLSTAPPRRTSPFDEKKSFQFGNQLITIGPPHFFRRGFGASASAPARLFGSSFDGPKKVGPKDSVLAG